MRDTNPDTGASANTNSVKIFSGAPFPGELMIWLSASFPVGGFAYSQGLETAVERSWVTDRLSLTAWLNALLQHGALKNDLIALSLIQRAKDENDIQILIELVIALQPSAERAAEAIGQGRSFVQAYETAWCDERSPFDSHSMITLPSALALAARRHGIATEATLEAYGIAYLNNLISAAVRLSIIGQFDGQRIVATLLAELRLVCADVIEATEADLGSATYGADLASMLHETQKTRLFRS